MKRLNILLLGFVIAVFSGCTYTFPEPEKPTSGTADFSKVVAVGNSLTAGYMDGALYNDGQEASFANIVATQMQQIGGGDFNQPDINAENGFFGLAPDGMTILGRLVLKNPLSPAPSPVIPGDPITPYSGGLPLNNFGIPGIRLIDFDVPGYGNSTNGNPYFTRFASSETASVLGDAKAANGTFFIFWLGNNDVLGYATGGASNPASLTDPAVFDAKYKSVVADLITSNGREGVLINIPNVQDIAFFTTVPWDAIPMDQATADATNQAFGAVNGVFDALKDPSFGLDADDLDARKLTFKAGNNPITMYDKDLVDLGPYFDALENAGAINAQQRAMLEPYRQSRPMVDGELVTLTAGAVLGTLADPGNPATVIGVAVPLADNYALSFTEQDEIEDVIDTYNATIESVADASAGLELFDFNGLFADFAQNGVVINGSGMSATLFPPDGAFSLDGVHPNQRGSAYIASELIKKINEAFGSNIPNINPNDWPGNGLPIP